MIQVLCFCMRGFNSPLIFACASERDLELLRKLGVFSRRVGLQIDLSPVSHELPRAYAQRVAEAKSLGAIGEFNESPCLGFHRIVALGRRILGRPTNKDEVLANLGLLSGRRHRIYSSICLTRKNLGGEVKRSSRVTVTIVKFKRLSDCEMHWYANTCEGEGQEGGYDFTGRAQAFIEFVRGSVSGAAGLPILELQKLLAF